MNHSDTIYIDVWTILSIAFVILLLAFVKNKLSKRNRFKAKHLSRSSTPPPRLAARFTEAFVIGASASVVIAIMATQPSNGGLMLMLDKLQPHYAIANIIMFACAVIGASIAVFVIIRGRTITGIISMAALIIGYVIVLNSGKAAGSWILPDGMGSQDASVTCYTIDIANADITDAELWVNGAYIGNLPYKTTIEEFISKVPVWIRPPEQYKACNKVSLEYEMHGISKEMDYKWIQLPSPTDEAINRPAGVKPVYYAQVRCAGEWAFITDSLTGSYGKSPHRRWSNTTLSIKLPERAMRMEQLLNKARLMDYHVDDNWLSAIETYGRYGWQALQEICDNEPEMRQIPLTWMNRKYHLDNITDTESAWLTFQDICNQADTTGYYSTNSVDGMALEILISKLDPLRLIALAKDTIYNTRKLSYAYSYSQRSGQLQFETSYNTQSTDHINQSSGYTHGWDGQTNHISKRNNSAKGYIPPHAFVIAHAIWKLSQEPSPIHIRNLIQEQIVPTLICWRPKLDNVAAFIGGPTIYPRLIRNYRQAPVKPRHQGPSLEDIKWIKGIEVNRWLYLLANMPGQYGHDFRTNHQAEVIKLADELLSGPLSTNDMTPPSFLFMDTDGTKKSLAAMYWPRFRGHALARHWSPLNPLWQYLIEMEPASTVQQYVDAWKSVVDRSNMNQFAIMELANLPAPKRQEIIAAIQEEVRQDPNFAVGGDMEMQRDSILQKLDEQLIEDNLGRLVKKISSNELTDDTLSDMTLRCLSRPNHPLVTLLAQSDTPDLRLTAIAAIRKYATPQHRQLLTKLAKDPAPTVRATAMNAVAYLKVLAAESSARYASDMPYHKISDQTTWNQTDIK